MKPTRNAPENWKPVVGYIGYEVSDQGRVRSIDRLDSAGRKLKGRILRPRPKDTGHLRVNLRHEGKTIDEYIHRLVLDAFVGPAPEGMECCHNNGDPADNRFANLRWDTRSENLYDAVKMGSHHESAKTECRRGHLLVAPNLRPSNLAKGSRQCLACGRARSYVGYHKSMKKHMQFISDQYFEQIMKQST